MTKLKKAYRTKYHRTFTPLVDTRNHPIVRVDGLGQSVKHFLDRAPADRDAQHRRTKGLYHAAAVAIGPSHFAHERTESGPIARGMLRRHLGFMPAAALRTPALVQHPVRHLHLNGRPFQHLMCGVRSEQGQRRVPTRAPLGPYLAHGRRG
jgi:hypothetical protein